MMYRNLSFMRNFGLTTSNTICDSVQSLSLHPCFTQTVRYASEEKKIKKTCLYDFHTKHGAKMEKFAGYSMPIVYKNQTIKSEHVQTREAATAFDVSHMMQTIIHGKDRIKFLERLTPADIASMPINKCTLSVFTNESGGIIDDCIIAKRENFLHIVSNAGNADVVWGWLNHSKIQGVEIQLEKLDTRGLIALQGPMASAVLQELVHIDLSKIQFMNATDTGIKNVGCCVITRCGYTGEDGFEISFDHSRAELLMEQFCKNKHVLPAGLGARDTLRLEAGLCLHGHDITDKVTPVEADLSWTIHKRRRVEGGFLGSKIILDQLKKGSAIKRVGLVALTTGPPAREGCEVNESGHRESLGKITSGTFAPVMQKNIAMAYLPTRISKKFGDIVTCDIRGKTYEYEITKMPFVKTNYYIVRK